MDTSSRTLEGTPNCCPMCGNEVIIEPAGPGKDVLCPHCGELLWFVRKIVGEVVVLTFLPGLMSGSESVRLFDEVSSAIGDSTRVLLNLSLMRFVTSVFLAMLAALHKRVTAANGRLKICGLQPEAAEALKIAKFDTMFDIGQSEQGALDSMVSSVHNGAQPGGEGLAG